MIRALYSPESLEAMARGEFMAVIKSGRIRGTYVGWWLELGSSIEGCRDFGPGKDGGTPYATIRVEYKKDNGDKGELRVIL